MKRFMAIADRASLFSLKLLAALNILFLLSFLLILLMAGRAHAEAAPCTGTDMLPALRAEDPDAYRKIEAEAEAIPNGHGRLWKLEKAGERPSYLFGTMHLTDPRVLALPEAAQAAFDKADTLVIETTDALDKRKMMASLLGNPDLTMFTDGTTLPSLLSAEDAAFVEKALDKRGIPLSTVARMKPWLLSTMVALPACEMARQGAGEMVLDMKLGHDAMAAGKSVEGLEKAAEQFSAMASLPISMHMRALVETLKLGDRIADINETMIALYQKGDIGMIWPMLRGGLPGDAGSAVDYTAFEENVITKRNKVMAERAAPILAQGNVFMAVGALHLPGRDGLVEAFRQAGYTVTPAD